MGTINKTKIWLKYAFEQIYNQHMIYQDVIIRKGNAIVYPPISEYLDLQVELVILLRISPDFKWISMNHYWPHVDCLNEILQRSNAPF